jgi:hypothetical protein
MATLEALEFSFIPLADARTVQLLATSLCLVAALLLAAIIIALVSRWRRRRDAEEDLSPNALLAQFRALYEAGTITQEEFERLRTLLGPRLRDNLGVPPKPPPAPPEPSQPPPDKPDTGIRPA